MKLYDLFHSVSWEDVAGALKKIYKEAAHVEAHKKAFDKILSLKQGKAKGMRLYIYKFGKDGYDISGKDGTMMRNEEHFKFLPAKTQKDMYNKEECWGIGFRPWTHWLDMEIGKFPLKKKLGDAGVIALCLYEMTFVDYEEAKIQKRFGKIVAAVKEVKKQIKKNKGRIPVVGKPILQ